MISRFNNRIVIFRLKPIDIKFMQLLHERVNIVPVIGKSDTLTKKELQQIKVKVRKMCCFPLTI